MPLPLDGIDDSFKSSDSEKEFLPDLLGWEKPVGEVADSDLAYRGPLGTHFFNEGPLPMNHS